MRTVMNSEIKSLRTRLRFVLTIALASLLLGATLAAEECQMGSGIDGATRSALDRTTQQFFQQAKAGDSAGMQQNAIPAVSNNFSGVQNALAQNKDNFASATETMREVYLLNAPGNATIQRAEFNCGIFNSPDRVSFVIPNLPPGKYALVITDVKGGKSPLTVSYILQQDGGGAWKLAGFYVRNTQIGGHDGSWFLEQAKAYKAKGQMHDAWFYGLTAWDLLAPVPFMSTDKLDRIYDDAQASKPQDLPQEKENTVTAGSKTFRLSNMFVVPIENGLGLVVKYQSPDISNTAQTFADNMAVMKAVIAKYPEFRDAFGSIVARAVSPSGQEYGSLLAMKDVK